MAFDLRVVFTGLCTFVRNSDESRRCKMCVVLPDGRGTEPVKLGVSRDGRPLRRHRGFLQFNLHQLDALATAHVPVANNATAVWYFERHRVTFLTVQADRKREPLTFENTGIRRVADLSLIVPRHSEIRYDALGAHPPEAVLAQVLLHEGTLKDNQNTAAQWVFGPTLSGRVLDPALSHEVFLEMQDLDKVDVIATPFDGGPETRWSLTGTEQDPVTITIANLCDDNPLRWETSVRERTPDDDFRWYYRLLSEELQDDLNLSLRGLPFPIPQPVLEENEDTNGQAVNCIPSQGRSAAFNLDPYLPLELVAQSSVDGRRTSR